MEIYLEDSNGHILCFNHAVKAVIENNEKISIKYDGNTDLTCEESGNWWVPVCEQCEEEENQRI